MYGKQSSFSMAIFFFQNLRLGNLKSTLFIGLYIYLKNAAYIVSCTLFDCKACISPYGYCYPLILINGFACCKYLEDGAVVLVDNLFILIFFQRDCRQSFKGNFSVKKSADFSCPQYIKGLSSCTTR